MFIIYTNIIQIREEEEKDINAMHLPNFPQKLKVLQSLLNTWDKQKNLISVLQKILAFHQLQTLICNAKWNKKLWNQDSKKLT